MDRSPRPLAQQGVAQRQGKNASERHRFADEDAGNAMNFEEFFRNLVQCDRHDWQARLAADDVCRDRLVRIPTGFGKTAGVTIAWLWNRVHKKNPSWPRRLIFCLPMRTLVEQTERVISDWIKRAGLDPKEQVHVLLGGLSPSDWHLEPEREAVLIGTQDMLLSRALNRGYGSGRARWPMEHGLLNVDCLWVMDEIQLMDVGLATSAQLQGFAGRDERDGKLPRIRRTWWMSATLQRDWLRRAPDLGDVDLLSVVELQPPEQVGPLWEATKTLRVESVPAAVDQKAERWASLVAEAHNETGGGVTLAIANTVKSALSLHRALERIKSKKANDLTASVLAADVDLRLVHSRFRGTERRKWADEFLARERCGVDENRIIVATQVVEAGVDISAQALVTELAPWASLVQRFGRCARYGGKGQIVVVDRRHTDDSANGIDAKDAHEGEKKRREADRWTIMPYELSEVESAAEGLLLLSCAAGPSALEVFEKTQAERKEGSLLPRLYPYEPLHVITQRELKDLFDTGPDLTGADIDISRFVREGDERDLTVWWWPVPDGNSPHKRLRPGYDALCRIPIGDARKWLFVGASKTDGTESFAGEPNEGSKKTRPRAWVWSYLEGEWERLEERHVYAGQTVLVHASAGGYDPQVGFTAQAGRVRVDAEHARELEAGDAADAADEQDELSEGVGRSDRQYKTIATHNAEVAVQARIIAKALGLPELEARVLELAGLSHDIGKAHPAFAAAVRDRNGIPAEILLAKAPRGSWHPLRDLYDHSSLGKRPGFRHELASVLGLLEFCWRVRPDHPSLQGGREELLDLTVGRELPGTEDRIVETHGMVEQLVELDAKAFNLVLYLVLCHHGKVRATLPMSPKDQGNPGPDCNLPIRGVRDGDLLPALAFGDIEEGHALKLLQVRLRLDVAKVGLSPRYGPSWVERVLELREHYGEFQLTWLEALLRVADVRASRIAVPADPRVPVNLVEIHRTFDARDRNAELRKWIDETLSTANAEPHTTPRARTGGGTRPRRTQSTAKKGKRIVPGGAL